MGYRDDITIDLSEDFGEGCSVTIRNPRVVLRLADFHRLRANGTEDEAAFTDELTGRAKSLLVRLITSWNVPDAETGQPLPAPDGDVAVLDRAPEFVLLRVFGEVNELMTPLFKRRGTTTVASES